MIEKYPCGCEKEKSVRYLNYLKKGVLIFSIASTAIAVTLTVLYFMGIKP